MKTYLSIWSACFLLLLSPLLVLGQNSRLSTIDFYGTPVSFSYNPSSRISFTGPLTQEGIMAFHKAINEQESDYSSLTTALLNYKQQFRPDDWLYYQLVRKAAQLISPKAENYEQYTLYKWYLLNKSGYDAILTIAGEQVLFYVRCDENIYNIPTRMQNGQQYVCLNYHDYPQVDFEKNHFSAIPLSYPEASAQFSYRVTQVPDFKQEDYVEKDVSFDYHHQPFHFTIRLASPVKSIFANYPVVDYNVSFNIPLSKGTYSSLIPELKKHLAGKKTTDGIDFLMRFTRYAFLFAPDREYFGAEKRMSPEQTLLYENSDCEDRAALFFYLVKEIYNLPMLVLSYPEHVTVAVKLDKPIGKPILFNGEKYSVCEPTPQQEDLAIGQMIPSLRKAKFEIAYAYKP